MGKEITVAPSATPKAAAGNPAATAAAPSAATDPSRLEYYDRLASLALKGEPAQPESPQPGPQAAGQESPPAGEGKEAGTKSPTPGAAGEGAGAPGGSAAGEGAGAPGAGVQTLEPGATPGSESEELEVSPEEQAQWTEGERRIHAALVKERAKRKEARGEVATLREELEALKAKVNTPGTAAEQRPAESPTEPAPEPAPAAPVPGNVLADCNTFEAVDARAMQAATMEAQAMRLQTVLARQGREAVAEQLGQAGVKQVAGVPVAEASEEQLGNFLASVYQGARETQVAAEPRKRFLMQQATAWEQAAKDVPELNDPKSARFAMFRGIVHAAPWIRQRADWPNLAVTQLLGMEARAAKAAPKSEGRNPKAERNPKSEIRNPNPEGAAAAVPAAATTTPPAAAPRSLPGAPGKTPGNPPKKSEADEIRARMRAGTATVGDIDRLASLSLQGQAVAA